MLEHPIISQLNRTGHIKKEIILQDKYGDEILPGDSIVLYDGEIVLHDNLGRFLESLGFKFSSAD